MNAAVDRSIHVCVTFWCLSNRLCQGIRRIGNGRKRSNEPIRGLGSSGDLGDTCVMRSGRQGKVRKTTVRDFLHNLAHGLEKARLEVR